MSWWSFSFTLLSLSERWMAVGSVPFAKNMPEMSGRLSPHIFCQAEAWIRTCAQRPGIFTVFQLLTLELQPDSSLLARNELWLLSLRQKTPLWNSSGPLCATNTSKNKGLYTYLILQLTWIKNLFPPSHFFRLKYYSK